MRTSGRKGFTLIELLVVIIIMAILMTIAGLSARDWLERYAVEGQIREMYSDLMNVRARAMQRNRTHFVYLAANAFSVYEDTNTPPDGNGTPDAGDRLVLQKTLKKAMENTQTPFNAPTMVFDSKGMTSDNQKLCIFSDVAPAFDCMIISATRINPGRITNQGGACNAEDNCVAQ